MKNKLVMQIVFQWSVFNSLQLGLKKEQTTFQGCKSKKSDVKATLNLILVLSYSLVKKSMGLCLCYVYFEFQNMQKECLGCKMETTAAE